MTSLGNYWLPFLYKIIISYPTGKILRYIDQNKTDLVYSVQIRCLLGADSVLWWNQRAISIQLGPPLFPVQIGADSVQIGVDTVLGWNQRAISIQLRPPLFPVQIGADSVQTRCSNGTRELFPFNYVLHYFRFRSVQTRVTFECSLLNAPTLYEVCYLA